MIVTSLLYLALIGASPVGLVIFGAALFCAFQYWRVALRNVRPAIGSGPLAFGYVMAAEGWLLSVLLLTGSSFGGTSIGLVLITFLYGLLPAFLVLTIVGVPVAVWLVRTHRLGYRMGAAVLFLFLAVATLLVALTSGGLGITGPAASFMGLMGQVAIVVLPPGGAAIAGLVFAVRLGQRRSATAPGDGDASAARDAGERRPWAQLGVQFGLFGAAAVALVGAIGIFHPFDAPARGQRVQSSPGQSVPVQSAPRPQGLLAFWIEPGEAAAVRAFIADLAEAEGFEVRDSSRAEAEAGVPLISLEIGRGFTTGLVVAGGRGLGTQPIEVDRLTPAPEFDAFTILLIEGLRERWPPDRPGTP